MRKTTKIEQDSALFLFFIGYVFLINYMHIFSHQKIFVLYPIFIILNVFILLYYGRILSRNKKMGIPRIRWIEYVFLLMIFFMDLSKVYHKEYTFVLLPFIIFGKLIPSYINEKRVNEILYINLIGILPFLLYAIYSFNHYSSYYNNSMGVLLSINSYFIILLLSKLLEEKKQKEVILLSLYLLVNLVTTYNTGSRTAILASISMFFYFVYYLIKNVEYISKEKVIIAISALTGLVYITRNQLINILNSLIYKWDGNGLDFSFTGRTGIWAYTLKNYEVFGGGKNFFTKGLTVSHGHNVLFNILGFYGVVPFVLIIIIILYGLYVFFKTDCLSVRLFILLFLIVNTFEGVVGGIENSYFQLLFFLHFGLLMKCLNRPDVSQTLQVKKITKKNSMNERIDALE